MLWEREVSFVSKDLRTVVVEITVAVVLIVAVQFWDRVYLERNSTYRQ